MYNRHKYLLLKGTVGTGVEVLVTGCPFCVSDLEDVAEVPVKEETVSPKDIAELLAEAVRPLVRGTLIPPCGRLLFPLAPVFPSL